MNIIIGSARIDENGKLSGGAAGDQKQTGTPDHKGEVSMQAFYIHKKEWYVIRLKDPAHAREMARAMMRACNNPNIGYSQLRRLDILKAGTGTKERTSCDCSSLIRQCFKETTGKDPGNFTTATEKAFLERTGLVEAALSYVKGMKLYTGDILVTKVKGHTAVVTDGEPRERQTSRKKSISEIAKEVIAGEWGSGQIRRSRLIKEGYNPNMVQAEVNRMLNKGN